MKILRINAPHFIAGVVLESTVTITAPIVKYMKGWTEEKVYSYCASKGWQIDVIEGN